MNAGRPRGLGRILFRYALREPLFPTLFAVFGLTAALLTKDLLGFSDLIINRGLGVRTVARIALYEAVPLASYTLPLAVIMGLLVALGRLGANRETVALEACGISPRRLVLPALTGAVAAALAGLLLSTLGVPWAARSLDALLERIHQRNPATGIRAGAILSFGDWKLEARETSSSGDRLRGVLLWMPDIGHTIFAETGRVEPQRNGSVKLALRDGVVLLRPQRWARQMQFETLETQLPDRDPRAEIEHANPLRALDLAGLAALARDAEQTHALVQRAGMELQRRFASPAAILVFGLLAVPLFLLAGRPSAAGGAVIGLVVTVAYYGLLQLGEGLVQGETLGPAAGAWLPSAAFLGLALALLARRIRVPAGATAVGLPTVEGAGLGPSFRRFPLERYVAAEFAKLTFIAFAVLFAGYLLTDVLERLDWFARYDATLPEVIRFYKARTPLLASRMVPMAFLAGSALAVSELAVRGELVAMRACGIPAARGLAPILVVAALAVPANFLLNDRVVPRSNALADHLKVTEIKSAARRTEHSIWYRSGDRLYQASTLDADVGVASDLTIYELKRNGLPAARTDAPAAKHVGDGIWKLTNPVRIEISAHGIREVPAAQEVRLGPDPAEAVDTMHLGVRDLAAVIRETEADGYDATRFRVDLHVKLAAPVACLVLPAAVLFLVIGGPPFFGPTLTLMVSAIVGVAFVLLSGAGAALGYAGTVPPLVAGWGMTALLALLAGALAIRNYT